jgi:hypothetical protein
MHETQGFASAYAQADCSPGTEQGPPGTGRPVPASTPPLPPVAPPVVWLPAVPPLATGPPPAPPLDVPAAPPLEAALVPPVPTALVPPVAPPVPPLVPPVTRLPPPPLPPEPPSGTDVESPPQASHAVALNKTNAFDVLVLSILCSLHSQIVDHQTVTSQHRLGALPVEIEDDLAGASCRQGQLDLLEVPVGIAAGSLSPERAMGPGATSSQGMTKGARSAARAEEGSATNDDANRQPTARRRDISAV